MDVRLETPTNLVERAGEFAAEYREKGIVRIPGFLPAAAAEALYFHLRERPDWLQVVNYGDKLAELSREVRQTMSEAQRLDLDRAVYAAAREGFQYRYEAIRVPDELARRKAGGDPLGSFVEFMTNSAASGFISAVLGDDSASFADGQATAYSPGDFLTGHDDDVEGKGRVAAYVMSLTPTWRVEWGGLLLMHRDPSGYVEGHCPAFNTITIFRVPVMHSVSEVTRSAPYRRMSITGWLRNSS